METYHNYPAGGHWGRDKTLDLIRRQFHWDGMTTDVAEYIATCPVCQSKAMLRRKPYGQL